MVFTFQIEISLQNYLLRLPAEKEICDLFLGYYILFLERFQKFPLIPSLRDFIKIPSIQCFPSVMILQFSFIKH